MQKVRSVILTYESDFFGASGCFLADIELLKDEFSSIEYADLEDRAQKSKEKINELKNTPAFFWNVISSIAMI